MPPNRCKKKATQSYSSRLPLYYKYTKSFVILPYFLNKRANKKEVLAAITKLIGLIRHVAIVIGQDVSLETTPTNIKRQPITTNALDIFVILTSSPPLCGYKSMILLWGDKLKAEIMTVGQEIVTRGGSAPTFRTNKHEFDIIVGLL